MRILFMSYKTPSNFVLIAMKRDNHNNHNDNHNDIFKNVYVHGSYKTFCKC